MQGAFVRPSTPWTSWRSQTRVNSMLLLVFTVVEAPDAGWASLRTIGSLAAVGALLASFAAIERRTAAPLVRLGILRSPSLVQANLGAMMLIGGWFGFQFIATLYMQQLRGWSPLETGLAIFPGGALVAVLAPRIAPFVIRFGVKRLVTAGLASTAIGYALFLPIELGSGYVGAILPTVLLGGFGFALAYGPLSIAATNGIPAHEQGLASGLVNTSFQFGGALVLAVVTAVNNAYATADGTPQGIVDGFEAAVVVSVVPPRRASSQRPCPSAAAVEPRPTRRRSSSRSKRSSPRRRRRRRGPQGLASQGGYAVCGTASGFEALALCVG
jgi:hypothetical protein